MKPEYVGLWQRMEQFQLDAPTARLPFSARLAKENDWTPGFTRRAIEEYKRFAFLAVTSAHPVSPSDAVDQVWHLHMTYTQNYWKTFCGEVLGKPLHHFPTEGGSAEREKFDNWYQKTLEAYSEQFQQEPPREIWPAPQDKQAKNLQWARVDKASYWLLSKPRWFKRLASGSCGCRRTLLRTAAKATVLSIVFLAVMAAGCAGVASDPANPLNLRGPDFLRFYCIALATCFAMAGWLRWHLRKPADIVPSESEVLDPYDLAYLNEGKVLTVNAAITSLVEQKALKTDSTERKLLINGPLPETAHPLEKRIYTAASVPGGNKIADIRESARQMVEAIADKLKAAGLVVADGQARKALGWPLLLAGLAPLLGVCKLFVGLSRNKPVGFLIAACVISVIGGLLMFARRPLRSRRGDALLRNLQARHVNLKRLPRFMESVGTTEFAMAVGLFGMTTLADTSFANLKKDLQPPSANGGCGSGCGGGCGGGGCGGGCGGCGGG